MAAMKAVSGIIRAIQGTKDKGHRIVKKGEHEIGTAKDATAGMTTQEVALTNGAAVMVAGQVLFRYHVPMRRTAKVEGMNMVALMASPTVEAAGRQMGIPSPHFRRKFRRYGRMLPLLNNHPSPAPNRTGNALHVSVCLKAVSSVPINRLSIVA
jgi:hypothetical protein